jgi:guanine deaminase
LIGAPGLVLTGGEGLGLVQRAWAADQPPANKPFDKEMAEKFMRRAIELSRKGWEAGEGPPFGAVVARDGKIVGESWNRRIATKDATAHAEMEAIRRACKQLDSFSLSGCDLYASAQPCPMCLAATYWARIDRVYYGNSARDSAAAGFDDGFIYEQLTRPPAQRKIPEVQLLGNEALDVFKDYAAKQKRAKD